MWYMVCVCSKASKRCEDYPVAQGQVSELDRLEKLRVRGWHTSTRAMALVWESREKVVKMEGLPVLS